LLQPSELLLATDEAGTGGPACHGSSIALGEGDEQAKRFQRPSSAL
jgi:hypothetical protein